MSGATTGGVDAGIPLQAGRGTTQPENPLQVAGQFMQLRQLQNQNALFPGQYQQQQIATQSQQVGLEQKINQAGYQALAPLLALPPEQLTHSVFTAALGSIEGNLGIPTSGILGDVLATAPSGDGPEFSNKIRSLITARMQINPETAANVAIGTPTTVNTGQAIQPGMVAGIGTPNAGAFTLSGAPVQVWPSRSELAGQTTQIDNNPNSPTYGQQIAVPLVNRLHAQGAGGLTGPAGGGVVGTAGPASPTSPPRLAPAAPGGGAAASGAVPVGLPPGAQTELDASAQHYASDNVAANTFQQRVFPLTQAATALATNPDTGPGTGTVNQIKSFLLAQSPDVLKQFLPGVDPNKIASYDEAVKYLAQYAMNQPGAANSDMHLGLAQVANASTHISNQAAQQVVQNALGLERMRQAATLQFNDTHPPGSGAQYDRFLSTFATANDPRGFSWDTQTPAQRQAAVTGMTRAAKERLLGSITLARQYGLNGGAGGQ